MLWDGPPVTDYFLFDVNILVGYTHIGFEYSTHIDCVIWDGCWISIQVEVVFVLSHFFNNSYKYGSELR